MTAFLLFPLLSESAQAHKTYSRDLNCYRSVYKETYHRGTRENPGTVTSQEVMVEKLCPKKFHAHGKLTHQHKGGRYVHSHHSHNQLIHINKQEGTLNFPEPDNNSCIEGTLSGGVLGGALGGVLARKENWIWSIPTGVVTGAIVGCQIDGG